MSHSSCGSEGEADANQTHTVSHSLHTQKYTHFVSTLLASNVSWYPECTAAVLCNECLWEAGTGWLLSLYKHPVVFKNV